MNMLKKRILSLVSASILIIGILANLSACTTAPPLSLSESTTVTAPAVSSISEPPPPPAPESTAGDSLIIATASETPSVAPARHNAAAGSSKNAMTHNSLFRVNPVDLEPIPDLVKEWRALSDVLFEFTLHEGILFHNGEEMTADDVVSSFHYVRTTPDARGAHASALAAEIVERYTFTIYTGEPNAALFFDLTHQGNSVMPASLIDGGHDFNALPIGSGPFIFENWRFGDSLTFRAFEEYFDEERAAKIETVTWRIIPEAASRTIALEAGEIDYILDVASADVARLEAHPGITVFTRPGTAFNYLVLNNSLPQFENIYARKAINMAIDQEALVLAAFDGLAAPTRAQVPTSFAGTTDEGTIPYDPSAAVALLAEHGIDPASLAFDMIASTEERRRMGEVVQAQLAEIGITTTITMNDHATTLSRMADGDFESAFGQWHASFLISALRGVLHSTSGAVGGAPNRSRIDNPAITALIDRGVVTIDSRERIAIFEEASKIANEYVGNVPTHLALVVRAFNSNLVTPEVSAVGSLNLNMMYWASR